MTSYTTGTVSVTNGSTTVTGSGTAWELSLINGGMFSCRGMAITIASVTSDNELVLDYEWPGADGTGLRYSVDRQSAASARATEANDRLAEITRRLAASSFITFDAIGTLAQRDEYDDATKGFIFLDISTDPFDLYIKSSNDSGEWAGPNNYGQGEQGDKGDKGDTGDAATVSVGDVDTTDFDQGAEVVNSGTSGAAVLDFTLPRGAKGWAIEPGLVIDGDRSVIRVADFVGGEGDKPSGTGLYVGVGGLVEDVEDAVSVRGATGPQGDRGVTWRGAWDAGNDYLAYDIVVADDVNGDPAAWIALTATTGDDPKSSATEWALFPGSFPAALDYGLLTGGVDVSRDYGALA